MAEEREDRIVSKRELLKAREAAEPSTPPPPPPQAEQVDEES